MKDHFKRFWGLYCSIIVVSILLCGGIGNRLRPVTFEMPKPLIPVQGKPVLQSLIELFKKYLWHTMFPRFCQIEALTQQTFTDRALVFQCVRLYH